MVTAAAITRERRRAFSPRLTLLKALARTSASAEFPSINWPRKSVVRSRVYHRWNLPAIGRPPRACATPVTAACIATRSRGGRQRVPCPPKPIRGSDIETGRQFYRAGSGIEPHSPLWGAFEKSKSGASAKLLIERGAKTNQLLPMQDYPLYLAARKDLPDIIELLLAKGVDVNQASGRKTTALEVVA